MPNVNSQTIYQMGNVVNDIVKQATGRDPVQSIEMAHVTVEQNTLLGIETLSGSVVRFRTPKSVPLLSLEAQIVAQQNLQGYDYPWPGGGSANKWNEQWENVWWTNGVKSASADSIGCSDKIPIIPETQYYIVKGTEASFFYTYYDINGDLLIVAGYDSNSRLVKTVNGIITTPADAYYMTFNMGTAYGNTYKNDISINNPATYTTYIPYSNICPITGFTGCNITVSDGDTTEHVYPVEWETEAGTVYGGVLDAKNGKLTVTYVEMDMGSLTYAIRNHATFGTYFYADVSSLNIKYTGDFTTTIYPSLSSSYRVTKRTTSDLKNGTYCFDGIMAQEKVTQLQIKNDLYDDATEFKTAVTGEEIIFELAEPVEYEVTPVAINTLAGDNVVSANTGDISLSYYVYSDLL